MIEVKVNKLKREYFLVVGDDDVLDYVEIYEKGLDTPKLIYDRKIHLSAGTSLELSIPNKDGTYIIVGKDASKREVYYTEIKQYDNLLRYIKKGIDGLCMDCSNTPKQDDCPDCNDATTEEFDLFLSVLFYFNLDYVYYKPILDYIKNEVLDEMDDDIMHFINLQRIGSKKGDLKISYKKMIILYYSSIVLGSLSQTADKKEQEELKDYYGYKKYQRCFNKYNFRLDDMQDAIDTKTRVFYWQTSPTQAIMPVADLISDSFLEQHRSKPYSSFEQGYKITLTQVGKLAIAIQFADLQDYIFCDMLGNDITDAFEKAIVEEEGTVLFLSKTHYIPSQIYLKIKRK